VRKKFLEGKLNSVTLAKGKHNCMRVFLFVGLSFSCLLVQAQFKNVLLEETTPEHAGSGPVVAISLKDSKNIIASTFQNSIHTSADGGLTWTKSKIESSPWGNPFLISDFKGDFFFFHSADLMSKDVLSGQYSSNKIVVHESIDNGLTWTAGTSIGLNESKVQTGQRALADRKGNFYVTWTQFDTYGNDDPACQSTVLLSRSSNGKKWSEPIQVSQLQGDCKDDDNTPAGAITAATADGKNVFIAWSNQGHIYMDRSMDGGSTWLSNDIVVGEQPGGWRMNIPGIKQANGIPTLICDNTKKGKLGGVLYMVWADQRKGEQDTDVWFARSVNYGDNWTQPLQLGVAVQGKHQFLPRITVDPSTGFLYIVYYDRSQYDDLQTDVYIAYSMDGGTNFSMAKISEKPFVPDDKIPFGDGLSISAMDGVIIPIWTRMDDGKLSVWTTVIKHEELEKVK
jgi:hypothetical protein